MGNPFHDPKTGEFTEGPGGGGGTAGTSLEKHDEDKHGKVLTVADKRAANKAAFEQAQFENKIAHAQGKPQVTHHPPHPDVSHTGLSPSQHAAMLKASNKKG